MVNHKEIEEMKNPERKDSIWFSLKNLFCTFFLKLKWEKNPHSSSTTQPIMEYNVSRLGEFE